MRRRFRYLVFLAAGLCIAGLFVVGAHQLLVFYTSQRTAAQAESVAQTAGRHAEAAILSTLGDLDRLAATNSTNCGADALHAFRTIQYRSAGIKEVGVGDTAGSLRCNQAGQRVVAVPRSRSISFALDGRDALYQVTPVTLTEFATIGLMVSRLAPDGTRLSAVISSQAVAPGGLPGQFRQQGLLVVRLQDGTLVGTAPPLGSLTIANLRGAGRPEKDEARATERWQSRILPLETSAHIAFADMRSEVAILRGYVNWGGLAVGILIVLLLHLAGRRPPNAIDHIREGMERDEFVPFYQPVIDLSSGRLSGCEVLVRWRKPDGSLVMPGAFIALAETSGLAIPMTRKLMEYVRCELQEAVAGRPELTIAFNLFDEHFTSLDLVEDVKRIFGPSGIAYQQLVFEITERQPLDNIKRAQMVIQKLQKLGAQVALDDAGTGHGGLAYLQQLGIDIVKIDKLFIDTITPAAGRAPIVDSLVELSANLGMEVVAEGVEDASQLSYLRRRGVQYAQGYLFAPPLPGPRFLEMVAANAGTGRPPGETAEPRMKASAMA